MKARTAKRMTQLQTWTAQVNACKQSGLPTKQWCIENGIKLKTYYNRMKILREEALDSLEIGGALIPAGSPGSYGSGLSEAALMVSSTSNNNLSQKGRPIFAAFQAPQIRGAAITIQLGEYIVGIQNGADDIMIERVLRTMARL